jgi:hypothetical protein
MANYRTCTSLIRNVFISYYDKVIDGKEYRIGKMVFPDRIISITLAYDGKFEVKWFQYCPFSNKMIRVFRPVF